MTEPISDAFVFITRSGRAKFILEQGWPGARVKARNSISLGEWRLLKRREGLRRMRRWSEHSCSLALYEQAEGPSVLALRVMDRVLVFRRLTNQSRAATTMTAFWRVRFEESVLTVWVTQHDMAPQLATLETRPELPRPGQRLLVPFALQSVTEHGLG